MVKRHLVRKDNRAVRIVALSEVFLAASPIISADPGPNGRVSIKSGQSVIAHDSVQAERRNGMRVFFDQNGHQVLEDNIVLVSE